MVMHHRFAPDASAPTEARRALRQMESALPPDCAEDLALLVSELVTNSVRHSSLGHSDEPIELTVEAGADLVRVAVLDHGRGSLPRARDPSPEQRTGWGLMLVDRLTDRWGVENRDGTEVWFEMKRPPRRLYAA
jgi:anti-sigma regulatory factor (Ser/Thr protein kinase)